MSDKRVAIRYAKAILGLALEQKLEEIVYNDFKMVIRLVASSKDLKSVFNSPVIQSWRKKNAFSELLSANVCKLTMDFVLLLTNKHRESLILDVMSEYTVLYNVNKGILPIEVISALELSDELRKSIVTKIEGFTNKKVEATFSIRPDIKGGFIVKLQDWVFDGSVQNQLNQLYKSLATGNAA
jgi:F-type H+-transporting ATPase subunit delta